MLPRPGSECTRGSPPWLSATWRTIDSPSPRVPVVRCLAVGAPEPVEHLRRVRRRQTRTGVGHGQERPAARCRPDVDDDARPGGGVPDRVGQQVVHRPPECQPVPAHTDRLRAHRELHVRRVGHHGELRDLVAGQLVEPELVLQLLLGRGARRCRQVLDQRGHPLHGTPGGGDGGRAIGGVDVRPVEHRVDVRQDDRERRPQLVGGVVDELPLPSERLVEPAEHLVDRPAQRPDLVVTAHRHPLRQVPCVDPSRVLSHPLHRAQRPAGQQPADEQAGDEQTSERVAGVDPQRVEGLRGGDRLDVLHDAELELAHGAVARLGAHLLVGAVRRRRRRVADGAGEREVEAYHRDRGDQGQRQRPLQREAEAQRPHPCRSPRSSHADSLKR